MEQKKMAESKTSAKVAPKKTPSVARRGSGTKPCPQNDWSCTLPKRCMTTQELNKLQMCCPCPGDTPYVPTCICVQQTPRIVCRKNIVWVQKLKHEPSVINTTRIVMIPKVIKVSRPIRVPEVTWTEGYVRAPKIQYRKMNITTYEIKHKSKTVMSPQEICTTFMCRPKPQWICIPPPTDYCCYSLDSLCSLPSQCPPNLPYHPNQNLLHHYPGSPGYPSPDTIMRGSSIITDPIGGGTARGGNDMSTFRASQGPGMEMGGGMAGRMSAVAGGGAMSGPTTGVGVPNPPFMSGYAI